MAMDSPEVRILSVSSDPTSYWRPEGVAVTASEPAFSAITLRAKTLAAVVPISIELAEDSSNAVPIIEQTIANEMAAKLDAVALSGIGSASELLGIRNHADVNTTASVGTPTNPSSRINGFGAP